MFFSTAHCRKKLSLILFINQTSFMSDITAFQSSFFHWFRNPLCFIKSKETCISNKFFNERLCDINLHEIGWRTYADTA